LTFDLGYARIATTPRQKNKEVLIFLEADQNG
jgi:hypothetical protein